MKRMIAHGVAPAVLAVFAGACLPTLHNARVEPGFRVDAGFVYLGDQERAGAPQRHDGLATVTPAYGFGDRVELGLPIGIYWEDGIGRAGYATGSQSQQVVFLPYAKLALLPRGTTDHLTVSLQAAGIAPGSIGLRYGRELGGWEPHLGLTWIASGGTAGDDPVVTRYQEKGQVLLAASAGATLLGRGRLAMELGVLRNSYLEPETISAPETRVTLYDVFIGVRVGTR